MEASDTGINQSTEIEACQDRRAHRRASLLRSCGASQETFPGRATL